MNKLCAENKFNLTQKAVVSALRKYGITDFTFEPITRGIANTTVHIHAIGQEFVMRLYAQHRKIDQDILFELHFQDYLRENGIPIPRIYPNTNGDKLTVATINGKRWQIILMEFIGGSSKTNHTPKLIKELATLQARMHLLGARFPYQTEKKEKSWIILKDYYAICIQDVSFYFKEAQEFITRAKNFIYPIDQTLPFGYNHLDLDLDGNVIVQDNRVSGIVDFDDLSYSPLSVCLGYSLWNVLHDENLENMRAYLKHYENIRPLQKLERLALPQIIIFRNYEIGALRLYKTGDYSCLVRPLEIEREITELSASGL